MSINEQTIMYHTGRSRSQHGHLCSYYRSLLCPYQPVTCLIMHCDFFRGKAHILANSCHFEDKFAHIINLISEELWWWLNIILKAKTKIAAAIHQVTSYDDSKRWLCSTIWTFDHYHLLEVGPRTHGYSVVSRLLAILHDLPAQHAGAREIWSQTCIMLTFLILNWISPFKNKKGIEKKELRTMASLYFEIICTWNKYLFDCCRLSRTTIWLRKPRGHKSRSGQSGRVVANLSV